MVVELPSYERVKKEDKRDYDITQELEEADAVRGQNLDSSSGKQYSRAYSSPMQPLDTKQLDYVFARISVVSKVL